MDFFCLCVWSHVLFDVDVRFRSYLGLCSDRPFILCVGRPNRHEAIGMGIVPKQRVNREGLGKLRPYFYGIQWRNTK